MNPIALQLGPISIRWYAICIVTGVILAVYLSMKEAPRKRINPDDIIDFILIAFPLAIIGARLNGATIASIQLKFLPSGMEVLPSYGGLLTGALVLYLFSHRRMIDTIDFLDIAAPSVMIAQSIGRWGNFFNQEAYGRAVNSLNYLPSFIRDQMYIDGSYRQPTFLYESCWNLLGFVLILLLRRKPQFLRQGEVAGFYLVWYGFGRMIIEGMRTDSLMFAGIRVSQWLSILLILVGLGVFVYQRRKKAPYYVEVKE